LLDNKCFTVELNSYDDFDLFIEERENKTTND